MSKEINLYDLSKTEIDNVEEKLKEDPNLSFQKDSNERTLLHWAALHGKTDIVKLLLKNPNINIELEDDTKATPLILATLGCHPEIVQLLITKGANVNHRNAQGHSPLQYACSKENEEIVKVLLEKGADINIKDSIQDTPLHRLAMKGHIDILKRLLNHSTKPDLNAQNKMGSTPLHIACEDDQVPFVMMLIDAGADIRILNKDEESPLDVCKPVLRRQIKTKLNITD